MEQFVVLLDNIRSLHNVGSIFRTADGVGADKLYLCGITGKPPRTEIRKAALGAEEFIPWEYHKDIIEVIDNLKKQGYHIVALENQTASVDYKQLNYRLPMALIVGNEFHGINESILKKCDDVVSIPMWGKKNSLNVSVAFGIAAYEIVNRNENES